MCIAAVTILIFLGVNLNASQKDQPKEQEKPRAKQEVVVKVIKEDSIGQAAED
jgi:hypothetical protein